MCGDAKIVIQDAFTKPLWQATEDGRSCSSAGVGVSVTCRVHSALGEVADKADNGFEKIRQPFVIRIKKRHDFGTRFGHSPVAGG
jgi:hypothetical protein